MQEDLRHHALPYNRDFPCAIIIRHGPGHQSKTKCDLVGLHPIHHAVFGRYRQEATWRGGDVSSGFFDEAPEVDDE